MSLKLYDLPAAWNELQEALLETGGELTPEIEALWAQIQDEGTAKVDAACCVLKHLKATSEALASEIGRLDARKHSADKAEERLRSLILPAVEAAGGKVKTDRFTTYTTKRTNFHFEVTPGFQIWELPAHWLRTRDPELAKTEIKKAIEAGEEVPEALTVTKIPSVSLTVR